MKLKLKISNRELALAGAAACLAAAMLLLGMTGLLTLVAMALFFFLPFYLIIRKFDFDQDEKAFFAFFIGLGLFSMAVFYVGRIIPSFRISAAIAFVALLLLPFALKKFLHKKKI